jgi:hypothetical protein
VCVYEDEYDASRVVFDEPKVYKPKGVNNEIKTAKMSYLNSDNNPCDFYIELPESDSHGISPVYLYGDTETNVVDGYKIVYKDNSDYTNSVFDSLNTLCNNKLEEWKKSRLISKNTTYKSPFVYQKYFDSKSDTFIDDETKSKVAFIKLNTYKDKNVRIYTEMYDETGNQLNPLDYISKPGKLKPIVKITGLYFGDKGKSKDIVSLQMKVEEIVFKSVKKRDRLSRL